MRPSSLRAVMAGKSISHNSKAAIPPAPSSSRCRNVVPLRGLPMMKIGRSIACLRWRG